MARTAADPDARRGTVRLVSATGTGAKTQSGQFNAGLFQVLQARARRAKGLTELRLKGSSFKRCRARGAERAGAAQLSRHARRPPYKGLIDYSK